MGNKNREALFLDVVRDSLLGKLDDNFLTEDLDILAEYMVVRFLKTSVHTWDDSSETHVKKLFKKFLDERFSFIVTFVTIINSEPISVENKA